MNMVLTVVTVISSAAVGGIFFAFSGFVMTALTRISAAHGITAMQSINIAVQSWPFFSFFFGTGVMSIVLTVGALMSWGATGAGYVLGGGVVYLIGSIGVTIDGNVPWNNRLAAVDSDSEAGLRIWRRFVPRWLVWNHVRTIACFAASVLFLMGGLQ